MPFFDAVKSFAENDEKTARFVEVLEEYREKSAAWDVYGIISMIYEQSGILLRVLSEPDGEAARANLMLLCDFAAQFESTRYRGLFAFINYIQKLIEKDQTVPAARLRKSDGCVSLLSIHRSKGLEFPVVFLVNAGNDIVTKISGDILLDSALGAGAYVRDGASHRDFSSPCREVLKEKIKTDELNEYIRLLYVALTRAESHLFITAAMNAADAEKAIEKAYACGGCPSDLTSAPRRPFSGGCCTRSLTAPTPRPFMPLREKRKYRVATAVFSRQESQRLRMKRKPKGASLWKRTARFRFQRST